MAVTFNLHIGIDYSGAETPTSRRRSLQVYAATNRNPEPVTTPAAPDGSHWNWTRQEIAEWLIDQVRSEQRIIAGIDHGFSFPLRYFERYHLTSWEQFLNDFVQHWPTHGPHTYISFIRDRDEGPPDRTGSKHDFRQTEKWTSSAKSVFDFGGAGKVAHSTHAGIPWLLHIREEVGDLVHFWPFDGWQVPEDKSIIAEVYPSLFSKRYPRENRTTDQHDAYSIARWLKEMDERDFLGRYLDPPLANRERTIASLEGWILGLA